MPILKIVLAKDVLRIWENGHNKLNKKQVALLLHISGRVSINPYSQFGGQFGNIYLNSHHDLAISLFHYRLLEQHLYVMIEKQNTSLQHYM